MSGYSLLGLSDPTQWGIGGKDNFLSRFGVAMNRGLTQGDATYNLLNKQRSTMARTPYADMEAIAGSRARSALYQNSTRGALAQEKGSICLTAPSSYLCAQSRASAAAIPSVVVEFPPKSGRWASVPQANAYQDQSGQWRVNGDGTNPVGLSVVDEGDNITSQFANSYAQDMANEDQQWAMGMPSGDAP